MRDDIRDELREEFGDYDARHDYAEMFLESSIALQIKALRLQRDWTQEKLAEAAGMHQSQVSAMEQVTHSSWTLKSLKQLARAFDLRLRLSFESFGSLLDEYASQSRKGWERPSFREDPAFLGSSAAPEGRQGGFTKVGNVYYGAFSEDESANLPEMQGEARRPPLRAIPVSTDRTGTAASDG